MKKLVTFFMALAVVLTACSESSSKKDPNEGTAVLRLSSGPVLPEEYRIGRVALAQASALTKMDASDPDSVDKAVDKAISTLHVPNKDERKSKEREIRKAFFDLKSRYPDLYQSVVGLSVQLEPGKRKAHVRFAVKSGLSRGQVSPTVYRSNVYVYDDELVKTPQGWKSIGNPTSAGIFFYHENTQKEIIVGLTNMGLDHIDLESI